MISETKIEVRYAETDQMGVVYHANYLIWFEVARTDFLKTLGHSYESFEKRGIVYPVLKAEIEYGTSVRYGDTITVLTKVIEISSVKSTYAYEVYTADQVVGVDKPCCTGRTTHCLIRKSDFRPLGMKKFAPELYEAYSQAIEPI